jgi:hypothetical protein
MSKECSNNEQDDNDGGDGDDIDLPVPGEE